jgi:hypothetical protein
MLFIKYYAKSVKIYILARDSKILTVPVKTKSRTPDAGVK